MSENPYEISDIDDEIDVPHFFCGDCIHWKLGKGGRNLPCKRIDHKTIKFAVPWFKSYDANQFNGCICADFEPKRNGLWGYDWQGFEQYWPLYVEEWLPYGNENTLLYFTLHNDTSVRYGVQLMDFVNGAMIDGNTLKAVEKMYYKKDRDPNGFGYRLVREPIKGVPILLEGEHG